MSADEPGLLKRLWTRLWLRRASFSARYGDLEQLYKVRDPWNLLTPREQARFAATNALVAKLAPATLLEIGSGEGAQTHWLQQVAGHVTGIEVSAAAVARAKQACPGAEFHEGRAEDAARLLAGRHFDLVTAFEVLYYAADVPVVLAGLQGLGERLLVTAYRRRAEQLRPHFTGQPGWRQLEDISAEGTEWEVWLWERERG